MARLAELGRRRRPSRCSDLLPRARGGAVARDRCCRPGRSPHAWHRDRERRKEGDEPREKDKVVCGQLVKEVGIYYCSPFRCIFSERFDFDAIFPVGSFFSTM